MGIGMIDCGAMDGLVEGWRDGWFGKIGHPFFSLLSCLWLVERARMGGGRREGHILSRE